MKSVAVLACLLLAAATVDASARFDGTSLSIGNDGLSKVWSLFNGQGSASSAVTSGQGEEGKAIVLIEYAVLPPVQGKFIEIFKRLLEATEKEEGVKVFGLSRTIDENLPFYLYSEWDDMKAYGSHFNSDYVKQYLEEISKIGVVWKLHILDQIAFIKPQ